MISGFILLFIGGMLLGGAWSFSRSRKPWWSVLALALIGAGCIGVSLWRLLA